MESRLSETSTYESKEANAIALLGIDPNPHRPARRVRRRRRSVRRRLVDSMIPFAVLIGLTLFAVGLVQIVEVGAAKQSRILSSHRVEPAQIPPPSTVDHERSHAEYVNLMRQHAARREQSPKPRNQVAYQLSLQLEAQREQAGYATPPQPKPMPNSELNTMNDGTGWSLFDPSTPDPRSTLQRGIARSGS